MRLHVAYNINDYFFFLKICSFALLVLNGVLEIVSFVLKTAPTQKPKYTNLSF